MPYVPAGGFWMGTDADNPGANPDEMPQHLVGLEAFWMDRAEVTNAQYERCVRDEGCSPPFETTALRGTDTRAKQNLLKKLVVWVKLEREGR
jgi:formylglycine-generating enzyme required for sulfatase activity